MTRPICILIFILAQTITLLAQNGITTREVTKLDSFDRIVLAADINLTIIKSDNPKITIRGERQVIAQVVCKVTDGELYIYATKFKYKRTKRIDITLETDTAITSIYGTSGNKVRCETAFKCQNLTLTARYGCDFFVNVSADFVKAKASHGSDIRLVGNARKTDLFAENACSIRAFNLNSNIVSVVATLSSNVDVSVNNVLYTSSHDNCEIRYKGNPQQTQITNLDSSRVLPVEDETI